MRPRPIALGIPPQASEGGREFRRRFGGSERLTDIISSVENTSSPRQFEVRRASNRFGTCGKLWA